MAYRPTPKTIKLGPFYDQLTRIVEGMDGGLDVNIQDAEGNLIPIENVYINEVGGFSVVVKQATPKK